MKVGDVVKFRDSRFSDGIAAGVIVDIERPPSPWASAAGFFILSNGVAAWVLGVQIKEVLNESR